MCAKKERPLEKNGDWEKVGQGRIGVIDLHAPHCVLRFAEGLSQAVQSSGYVPSASKKSHRAFAEQPGFNLAFVVSTQSSSQ